MFKNSPFVFASCFKVKNEVSKPPMQKNVSTENVAFNIHIKPKVSLYVWNIVDILSEKRNNFIV